MPESTPKTPIKSSLFGDIIPETAADTKTKKQPVKITQIAPTKTNITTSGDFIDPLSALLGTTDINDKKTPKANSSTVTSDSATSSKTSKITALISSLEQAPEPKSNIVIDDPLSKGSSDSSIASKIAALKSSTEQPTETKKPEVTPTSKVSNIKNTIAFNPKTFMPGARYKKPVKETEEVTDENQEDAEETNDELPNEEAQESNTPTGEDEEEAAPVKKTNSRVGKNSITINPATLMPGAAPPKKRPVQDDENTSDSPIITKSKRSISVDESPSTKQSTAAESGPLTHATKDRPKMSGRRPPTRGVRAQTIAEAPSTTTTTTQSKASNSSTQSKNTKTSTRNADDLLAAVESSATEDDGESGSSTNKSQKSNIDPTAIFSSSKNDPALFVFGESGTNSSFANSGSSTVDEILGGGSKKSSKKVASSLADDDLSNTNKSNDNEIFGDPLKSKKKKKDEKEKPVLESPSIFGDPLVGSKKKTNKS